MADVNTMPPAGSSRAIHDLSAHYSLRSLDRRVVVDHRAKLATTTHQVRITRPIIGRDSLPDGQRQAFLRPSRNASLGWRTRSHRSPARRSSRPMDAADGSPPQRPHFSSNYSKKMLVVGLSPGKTFGTEIWPNVLPGDRSLLLSGFDARKKKRRQRERFWPRPSRAKSLLSVPGQPRECSRQQAVDQAISCRIPPDNPASDSALMGL